MEQQNVAGKIFHSQCFPLVINSTSIWKQKIIMISITSSNLVAINHQVHRRATWRSQILEGLRTEKKVNVSSLFTKVYLSTCRS